MGLVEALQPQLEAMAARAAGLDAVAGFPEEDVRVLAAAGLPLAPLPPALGGAGLGTSTAAAEEVLAVLRLLGRANLSLGRLFEAHVNVVRLVARYGDAAQLAAVAAVARRGELFGLWVTDAPGQVLCRAGGVLCGRKGPGSGAGHLRHALVTVSEGGTVRMGLVRLSGGEAVEPIGTRLLGMRASTNGTVTLDGVVLPDEAMFGADGDYLREPELSTGAWRGMAVALGGLDALMEAVRRQLLGRGHAAAPLQQERFGQMLIAHGTAELWTRRAGLMAEANEAPVADQVATVNLARIAMEGAALELMRHAQRGLGLGAFVSPNPVERLLRDLGTYLRQPAPDDVLLTAARHHLGLGAEGA